MDIQSIKTFLQVASLENFTRAAEELNYAQSTVTMQIRRLEEELGFPLFERIGRRSALTAAGKAFLPHAAEMLRIMQKASALGQESREQSGTLRVGMLESLLTARALKVLPQFRAQFPNVDLLIKTGQAAELLTLLRQNRLDLIYISYAAVSDPLLTLCYRRQEEIAFFAGAQHPLGDRRGIPPVELFSYPFIAAEPSGRCYALLHELAAQSGATVRHAIMVDELSAIAALLQDGQSIAFLPGYAMEKELRAGRLLRLDAALPPQRYFSQILYHKNKWAPPYMLRFIELLRAEYPQEEGQSSLQGAAEEV